MIFYYRTGEEYCFSEEDGLPLEKVGEPAPQDTMTWLFRRDPGSCRASFLVSDAGLLYKKEEDVSWLNKNLLEPEKGKELPGWIRSLIEKEKYGR